MNRNYLTLALILIVGCKQPADKAASKTDDPGAKSIATAISPKKIYDYCYSNHKGVFVCKAGDPAGMRIKMDIVNAALSPDGAYLAYTDASYPDAQRRIGLMDLTTLKTTILDTGCHYCYGPVWSPDGKYLVYNAMQGQQWNIKYIDLETGHFAFLRSKVTGLGNFSPEWSQDSKKIILQDSAGILILDLKGNILRTIGFGSFDSTMMFTSSTAFLLTQKEDKLIFDCQVATDSADREEDGEPPPRLWVYDLNDKTLTRLGPRDLVGYGSVLKGDTIFCIGYERSSKTVNVYKMGLSGDNFRLAFRDWQDFSCRTR